jgi:hypothetical protein
LRSKILEVKAQQEEKIRAALEKSAKLLKAVIESAQPDQLLAQKLDEIDESFFIVLSANIEEAKKQKHEEAVKAFTAIGNLAMSMLQERQGKRVKPTASPKIEIAR